MKLRINQLSTEPPYPGLPDDLTGYAVTLDLSHCDAAHEATLGELISEIRSRGAARVVITGSPRTLEGTGREHAAAAA